MKRRARMYRGWQYVVSLLCVCSVLLGLAPVSYAATTLDAHVVNDTVNPSGISLNLFDYWVTDS